MFEPPACPPVDHSTLAKLVAILRGRRVAVLTGAGCSTESGIPDYRSPRQLGRVRQPIQHQEFVKSPKTRARYWARSLLGWPRFAAFQPNAAHRALADWELRGAITALITQNVDRLHARAGTRNLIELHGALERVRCLACGDLTHRDALQERLLALNPGFRERYLPELLPDGDAALPPGVEETFQLAPCDRCGGVLKPDVVFFGDNVPPEIVEASFAAVDDAAVLLVVGSSLAIHSGYRFVLRARRDEKPVVILNAGPTRADQDSQLKVDARIAELLPRLVALLS